jgi:hypothetical protein
MFYYVHLPNTANRGLLSVGQVLLSYIVSHMTESGLMHYKLLSELRSVCVCVCVYCPTFISGYPD